MKKTRIADLGMSYERHAAQNPAKTRDKNDEGQTPTKTPHMEDTIMTTVQNEQNAAPVEPTAPPKGPVDQVVEELRSIRVLLSANPALELRAEVAELRAELRKEFSPKGWKAQAQVVGGQFALVTAASVAGGLIAGILMRRVAPAIAAPAIAAPAVMPG